jgi:hypothetical protein
LATCHEQQGRTASAWSEFREAEAQATSLGDQARRKLAAQHAATLEPNLARVRIAIDKPRDGLVVMRDGVALGEAALGSALPVDPGEHAVAVTAPGFKPWTTRFVAVPGESVRVDIPELEPIPKQQPGSAADRGNAGETRRTIGLVVGAAGVAALAFGGVFVVLTGAKKSQADEHCPNKVCDEEGGALVDTAKTYATVADVGIGLGVAAVVTGAILFITAPRSNVQPSARGVLWRF